MTEFETEARAHLSEMLKRPMTACEQALLAQAIEERRQAEQAVHDLLINALLS